MEHFLQTCTADHFKMCALKLITCYVAFACLPCFLKPFFKTDFKRFPERNNFEGKNHLSVENRFDLSLLDTSAHNPFRTMPLCYKSIYLRHLTNDICSPFCEYLKFVFISFSRILPLDEFF